MLAEQQEIGVIPEEGGDQPSFAGPAHRDAAANPLSVHLCCALHLQGSIRGGSGCQTIAMRSRFSQLPAWLSCALQGPRPSPQLIRHALATPLRSSDGPGAQGEAQAPRREAVLRPAPPGCSGHGSPGTRQLVEDGAWSRDGHAAGLGQQGRSCRLIGAISDDSPRDSSAPLTAP